MKALLLLLGVLGAAMYIFYDFSPFTNIEKPKNKFEPTQSTSQSDQSEGALEQSSSVTNTPNQNQFVRNKVVLNAYTRPDQITAIKELENQYRPETVNYKKTNGQIQKVVSPSGFGPLATRMQQLLFAHQVAEVFGISQEEMADEIIQRTQTQRAQVVQVGQVWQGYEVYKGFVDIRIRKNDQRATSVYNFTHPIERVDLTVNLTEEQARKLASKFLLEEFQLSTNPIDLQVQKIRVLYVGKEKEAQLGWVIANSENASGKFATQPVWELVVSAVDGKILSASNLSVDN